MELSEGVNQSSCISEENSKEGSGDKEILPPTFSHSPERVKSCQVGNRLFVYMRTYSSQYWSSYESLIPAKEGQQGMSNSSFYSSFQRKFFSTFSRSPEKLAC